MSAFGVRSLVCIAFLITLRPLYAEALGTPFAGDPPDDHHPWAVNDRNRPLPPVVTPAILSTREKTGKAPSDATVLFDGTDLAAWQSVKPDTLGAPAPWIIQGDVLAVVPHSGNIGTRTKFGDCQLHLEWAAPTENKIPLGRLRGNSGIFLMGLLEINILDSYENPTFADGMAGAYVGVNPPLANALHPSGEFQSVDIVFRRPIYKNNIVVDPGYLTIFMNGVLIQDHTPIEGISGPRARAKPVAYPEKESLVLQDHHDFVRFRNIWIRELPPRAVEGGTDGFISTEAALAKRSEIASTLRHEAEKLHDSRNLVPGLLLLLESITYENNDATSQKALTLVSRYIETLREMSLAQRKEKTEEIKRVNTAFKYLIKFNILPSLIGPKTALDEILHEQKSDATSK